MPDTGSDLTKTEYTIFMLVKTTTDWLALQTPIPSAHRRREGR